MTGKDKDYRYMATSDLLNELNKDSFKLDPDLEMRLSSIILQQLDDVAGDVSGLAVKWLAFFSLKLMTQADVISLAFYCCVCLGISIMPAVFFLVVSF